MGGVHQAPVGIHRELVQQVLDRAGAEERQAVVDFSRLLGDVDVDGPFTGSALVEHRRELPGGHGAEGMRSPTQSMRRLA